MFLMESRHPVEDIDPVARRTCRDLLVAVRARVIGLLQCRLFSADRSVILSTFRLE